MAGDGGGDDRTLIKIAVFGITFSLIATVGLAILWSNSNEYDYDTIAAARAELIDFSGETMINQTPWILTGVATPWVTTDGVNGHLDSDGWLYGEYYTTAEEYPDIGKSANIAMDPSKKSTVPISVSQETVEYTTVEGYKWWAEGPWGIITLPIALRLGADPRILGTEDATIWNYTGYRYIFSPTLPFSNETDTVTGKLSLVWYSFNNQQGLSGGLQIYGGDVILSSYSAADIVANYNQTSAYATTYDFKFNGTLLTLSIRFDPTALDAGMTLMEAWSQGRWTMAISSASAGNFYDVEDSAAFTATAGNVVQTFIDIFTWDMPQVSSSWGKLMIWLLAGLPMTIAMLCVSLKLVTSVTRIFGLG